MPGAGHFEDGEPIPEIFISYRRSDASGQAGRIADRIRFELGMVSFIDTGEIRPADDFKIKIDRALDRCRILLVIIGAAWLNAVGDEGRRRLDDDEDFVRYEIRRALKRRVPILPVLVDGAENLQRELLPADIQAIAALHYLRVDHATFDGDFERLAKAIRRKRGGRWRRISMLVKWAWILPIVAVVGIFAAWMNVLDVLALDTRAEHYLLLAAELFRNPDEFRDKVILAKIDDDAVRLRPFGPQQADAWRADYGRLIELAAAVEARAVVFDLNLPKGADVESIVRAVRNVRESREGHPASSMKIVFGAVGTTDGGSESPSDLQPMVEWGTVCVNLQAQYLPSVPLTLLQSVNTPEKPSPSANPPALALAAVSKLESSAKVGSTRSSAPGWTVEPKRRLITRDGDEYHFSTIERAQDDLHDCRVPHGSYEWAMLRIRLAPPGYWENHSVPFPTLLDNGANNQMAGKIVLVGAMLMQGPAREITYVAGWDNVRPRFRVELHADAIATLLSKRAASNPTLDAEAGILAVAAVLGFLSAYFLFERSRWVQIAIPFGLVWVYLALAVFCAFEDIVLFVYYDVLAFIVCFAIALRLQRVALLRPAGPGVWR